MSEKRKVHPIIERALDLARTGENEPIELDEDAIEVIQDSLEGLFESDELFEAIIDLLNLTRALDENGSPSAAMALIPVITSASEPLKKLNKIREQKKYRIPEDD